MSVSEIWIRAKREKHTALAVLSLGSTRGTCGSSGLGR